MQEEYSGLIIRYLQGYLTEDEADAFFRWVRADDACKKLFFEIKAVYDAGISSGRKIDIEKSWQRLLKKRQSTNRNTGLWKRIASYAAVAIVAVCLTVVTFMLVTDKREIVATQYIGGDGLDADVVVLPDGTRVSLGSKTIFYYEPDYGKNKRNVFLEGEALFEVSHQKNKPFVVNINGFEIEALGTVFNVMAYPGDSLFITTLLEGSIGITGERILKKTVLKPNQQYVYDRSTHKSKIHNVIARDYTIWTTGYYYFYEQPLESILHRLSYVYGITFDVRSEKLNNTLFTGTFYRGQSVKNLMEIINLSVPIKYKIEDHHVIIYE
jgi:ferric-dicitrate binding protein FerR (iron transport regulator)